MQGVHVFVVYEVDVREHCGNIQCYRAQLFTDKSSDQVGIEATIARQAVAWLRSSGMGRH